MTYHKRNHELISLTANYKQKLNAAYSEIVKLTEINKFLRHRLNELQPLTKSKIDNSAFFNSKQWKELRYKVLKQSDGRCSACKRKHIVLHVDHIKSRFKYPELALDITNLQVLCEPCNIGKGSWDETDWRPQSCI